MRFNVSQLMKESIGSTRVYDVNNFIALAVDDCRVCRVEGRAMLLRTDRGVWVTAELASEINCVCSRCLSEFEQPIRMLIDDEYLPEVDVATGARSDDSGEGAEEGFHIDDCHILDITEAIRQYSSLGLPMKPTCSEECEGMCTSCGVNLNDAICVCDRRQTDARWDELLKLVSVEGNDH